MTQAPHRRVAAVDALRGLVVLLLVPDLTGGFSFHQMAELHPDSAVWRVLATQFSHVPWTGMALWDLVMPAFVLLVGVSLALSVDRRREQGDPPRLIALHAALRSAALIVLGLLMPMRRETVLQELVPYAVLAAALPWSRWVQRWTGKASRWRDGGLDYGLQGLAVAGAAVWIASHPRELGAYDLNQILTQLGLAYLPACLLMGRGLRWPLAVGGGILAAWGLAFAVYTPPAGVVPSGEVMGGLFGHWNNGTNLAAAFDRWFLNLLPRPEPYVASAHGYHTLQFIPLIANMLFGVAVGRLLMGSPSWPVRRLAVAGAAGLLAGLFLAVTVFPLVKSLWTPSWALVSQSVCVLTLAALLGVLDASGRPQRARALAVLGSNTILLYVIANVHRWRVVMYAERLLGDVITASPWRPLLQSLCVLAVLWVLAWGLDRARLHVRL